ncbi:hypothetical protein [Celerinatantimonas sp. MCCC 1A17872]|uniref:hypothetical protein n=1 Tax=Celerinatantimonas sp. MCCC 1A17872 TaxID=3177514 RepID=UPI0038C20818
MFRRANSGIVMVSILILLMVMTIATLNIIELSRQAGETVMISRSSNIAYINLFNQSSAWVSANIQSDSTGQWLCKSSCLNSQSQCGIYASSIVVDNHQLNVGMIKSSPPESVGLCAKSQLTQPIGSLLWMNR